LYAELESSVEDAALEQGVLRLEVAGRRQYVLNRQTPTRQIWVSSPVSGPARFNFLDGHWTHWK
jgi:frataxin